MQIVTAFSLSRHVLDRIERLATHIGLNRSATVEQLLDHHLPQLPHTLPRREASTETDQDRARSGQVAPGDIAPHGVN